MFYSEKFVVLTIVTVFTSCGYISCASLTNREINLSKTSNLTGRGGRQFTNSDNNYKFSSNSNESFDDRRKVGNGGSQSSFSITPSFSYQFHTNDEEHLDRIVDSHQDQDQSPNSFNSAPLSRAAVETIRSGESVPSTQRRNDSPTASYPAFHFPFYQNHNQVWSTAQDRENKQEGIFIQPGEKYLSRGRHEEEPGELPVSSHLSLSSTSNNSTRHVYSRLPKNHGASNGTPITNQGQQHEQMHTSGSYSSIKGNGGLDLSTLRSVERKTFVFPQEQKKRRRRPGGKRKILQSRQDTAYEGDEGASAVEDEEDEDHHHYYDHDGSDQYEQGQPGESYDHDHDEHDHDSENNPDEGYYYPNSGGNGHNLHHNEEPALRDFGQGKPGGTGGGFGGGGPPPFPPGPPGGFGGPLPPPPGPLKGSIDYILIPLILIGLAGPIFVVLYVVLGGFEYRLAPISRSLKSSFHDYQPYIDNITSSVGRALEKYECPNYAVCRLRGFSTELGLRGSTVNSLETALSSVTPKDYGPVLNNLFSFLRDPVEDTDCSQYKCSSMVDTISAKF